MAQITYTDKVALNVDPSVANINKVTDADMNEIKSVVNTNDTNVGDITTLTTSNKSSVVSATNEINARFNFSTTEQVIGTWTDGSTWYRKVVSLGNLPSSGSKSTSHGISNLDKVINIYGFANTNTYKFPLPYTTNSNQSNISLYASATNVIVEVGQDRSGFTGWAIMEYTKTS